MKHLCEFDCYRVDFERRLLLRGEEPIPLPSKALDILLLLIQRRGEVVSKDELMKAVWPDTFVEEGNLSQSIHVLRRALGETVDDHRYIVTAPGRGYRFVADVRKISLSDSVPTKGNWLDEVAQWFHTRLIFREHWIALLALAGLVLIVVLATSLPSIARVYNNWGIQLKRTGDIKAAIKNYQRAISLNSGYPEAHYNLASAYEEIPDYERALEEYQSAINADFTFYEAYNNLARLYILRHKDYGAALRLLDRALSLKPQEPSVQYSLHKNYGWANFELHHLGQAEQNLRLAVALNSERGAAHCLLAKVLDAQEKVAVALAEWESCAAYSSQEEVEPEWRNEAQEQLRKEVIK